MQVRHTLCDRQPQATNAPPRTLQGRVAQRLAQVQTLCKLCGQPGPSVFHQDLSLAGMPRHTHPHGSVTTGVLDRVVDQVGQRSLNELEIALDLQPPLATDHPE